MYVGRIRIATETATVADRRQKTLTLTVERQVLGRRIDRRPKGGGEKRSGMQHQVRLVHLLSTGSERCHGQISRVVEGPRVVSPIPRASSSQPRTSTLTVCEWELERI